MSFKKNVEQRFEELIASLAIPKEVEKIYRRAINEVFNQINAKFAGGRYFFPLFFDNIREALILSNNPFYGGSFDRHTNIRGISDIDVYFTYSLRNYRDFLAYDGVSRNIMDQQLTVDNISGEMLLKKLYTQLRNLEQSYILYSGYNLPIIKINRNPPYRHAIPIAIL